MGRSLMKKAWHFIHPVAYEKELMEKFKLEAARSRRAMQHLREEAALRSCYSGLLKAVTDMAGQMAWEKDLENRYVLANHLHCETLFGLDTEESCFDYLRGHTDSDLVADLYEGSVHANSFQWVSALSDNFTKDRGAKCYFIEQIEVEGKDLLFFVIKVPVNVDGQLVGTIGTAHDCTKVAPLVQSMLDIRLEDGTARKIGDKDVFCYYLEPAEHACWVFSHMCPVRPINIRDKKLASAG